MRKSSVHALSIVAFSALLACVGVCVAAEHTKDSLDTVKKNVADKKAVLVDVREQSEWDDGHVDGAIFVPLSELKKGIDREQLEKRIPKDKIVYTYCRSGNRSLQACDFLKDPSYSVRPLKPGFNDLVKAGFKPSKK